MKRAPRETVRAGFKLAWFAAELLFAAMVYAVRVLPAANKRHARARWLQGTCRRILHAINVKLEISGTIPARGLLISNHLSYLDIVVLGSLRPSVFVSKSEVANWPAFGWFARRAGTIFVVRAKRGDVARAGDEIRAALTEDVVVVLFPEGTSSGGETILPFRSSLLEPAVDAGKSIGTSCIQYHLSDGDPAEEVCYWRDMTLPPHLWNLLSKSRVTSQVAFSEVETNGADRKALAAKLHAEVSRLKAGIPLCPV